MSSIDPLDLTLVSSIELKYKYIQYHPIFYSVKIVIIQLRKNYILEYLTFLRKNKDI